MLAMSPARGGLTAGEVLDAGGETLLSASFRGKVQGGLRPGDPVLLGDLQAYRYSDLSVRGLSGTLTVYAVPTSAGVATITCWAAARAQRSFPNQCAGVAATLRLVGAKPYGLSPSGAYASLLSGAFDRLGSATSTPARQLSAASTPSAQANAAQRLAQAYTQADTDLKAATISPALRDANGAVVGALGELAGGYSRAAAAARSGAGATYDSASQEIRRGTTALHAALRGLAGLGYNVTP